ncbi:MAG: DEAD/DEAH box helicase family protein [Bacteroidota bacterium]|nr:restriction endonuclease subunit R [Odoribacter sp.]MDP3643504.1 DEAD/DEAH box helicase family protein [Bacteroidota bacterium]
MNEAQTEFEYIDPALKAAGWGVVEGSQVRKQWPISQGRLLGQGRRSKPLKADYVLRYKNRSLAVVEAKARDIYYTDGVAQAKDYAERLNVRFTYATNGLKIYGIDMQMGLEGDVSHYPSPEELWNLTFPVPVTTKEAENASWNERLFAVPFEDKSGTWQLRYYQDNAVTKVIEAIAKGETRILLTLATGTGKTAIAFQIAWKLFHSKWNINRDGTRSPRILFLADRNILADQAFNSFNAFEEDALVRIKPDEIRKKGKVPKNGSIFFTIFQTFMSGPGDTPYFGEYPADFFDFIIIDECHRGGAKDESTWRAIMDYFKPAVQLGLTATPKRDINGDTYAYFGEPVYVYSLKEGINDGFLSPFKVKEISTTIDDYTYEPDDVVETGEIDEGREYTEAEFNRIIEIKEREAYRVKLFMGMINQNHKTLVFCATQIHAAAIRDLINQQANSKSPKYCCRVTADDGKLGEQFLHDFQDNEKTIPTILTTSEKLSTGVDAPEIRNIVLLRTVNSMVEFKQIVGRGTRLYDGKDYFTIYDFVKAHRHFNDPAWDGPPLPPEEPYEKPKKKPCQECGENPCVCERPDPVPCPECGNLPCVCEGPPRYMITVKLADGKTRELDSMVKTSFWDPSGKPISAQQFIQNLFGDLPSLFSNENELRKIWSLPDTRKRLLEELGEKGYTTVQLNDLRKMVHGENSDLFDVLAFVAYHRELVPRLERAEKAKVHFGSYKPAQQDFLNFVLEQYVKTGFEELDDAKLPKLLELKYKALSDAKHALGDIPSIRRTFIGFQEHLYEAEAVG